MNANYLYDIFETTRKCGAPDLTIGLAMLKTGQPIPDGMTDEGIRQFLGRHYETLSKAYRTGDRQFFADTVAAILAQAEANGEEK